MIKVWILSLYLSWGGAGGSQVDKYIFITREECLAAQKWYSNLLKNTVNYSSCYQSYTSSK